VGLGAANVAAAFSGGYPLTGGFVRSVVNFDAGAETPMAGVLTAAGIALTAARPERNAALGPRLEAGGRASLQQHGVADGALLLHAAPEQLPRIGSDLHGRYARYQAAKRRVGRKSLRLLLKYGQCALADISKGTSQGSNWTELRYSVGMTLLALSLLHQEQQRGKRGAGIDMPTDTVDVRDRVAQVDASKNWLGAGDAGAGSAGGTVRVRDGVLDRFAAAVARAEPAPARLRPGPPVPRTRPGGSCW
jgi:Sulfate permease family